MGMIIFLVVVAAVFFVLFRINKTRSIRAYTAYYGKKRREFSWLDNWLNDCDKQNWDPVKLRSEIDSGGNNIIAIIVFFVITIIGWFFSTVVAYIFMAIGSAAALFITNLKKIKPGSAGYEKGLTLECPSCGCPHSWVMLAWDIIVEHEETTTETTTRSGYGKGDFFDSMSEGFKKDGTTTKVSVVYSGRSIKDFKCLNCGHTEHNEYDERWFNTRPREGLSTYNPPRPAWEIPEIYAKAAADKYYEEAKAEQTQTAPVNANTAAPVPSSNNTQTNNDTAGINPSLLKAAEMGNREACYEIATMFILGRGVEKDMDEAEKWLATKRDIYAVEYTDDNCSEPEEYLAVDIFNCGYSAYEKKNFTDAVTLYQMAADMGCDGCLSYLGKCYENGEGVPVDKEKALYWYQKSADNIGDTDAKDNVKRLKKELRR